MLSELLGRLPIRVELKGLTKDDFYRILTEPQNSLVKQHEALMATEGVRLVFTDEGLRRIAQAAEDANRDLENIGARRLFTIFERILEPYSFDAPEMARKARERGESEAVVTIGPEEVNRGVKDLIGKKLDLSKYVI